MLDLAVRGGTIVTAASTYTSASLVGYAAGLASIHATAAASASALPSTSSSRFRDSMSHRS